MRSGLDAGEFHIEYQPIMDLNDSDLMGFEALARWDHPERGPIPPSEFIPMAEESGAILQIGEWVLRNSLMTLAQWRKTTKGADNIFMSVNLSTKQFARMELERWFCGHCTMPVCPRRRSSSKSPSPHSWTILTRPFSS